MTTAFASPEISLDGLTGQWWVVHTKSRQEKALAGDLARLDVFCYLPVYTKQTVNRRTGRIFSADVPLFPGYAFINGTREDREQALKTNRLARTIEVVDPQRLVHELMQVQRMLVSGAPFSRSGRLRRGDAVRVTRGPLRGVEGVVIRVRSRWRLVLNVDMLGQSVQVEVEADALERL